ncbi:MAG: hypothetical protein JSU70_03125, partial [Phycisphaerales bacterium]
MDKPNFLIKPFGRGSLSTVLVSILLAATILPGVAFCQGEETGDDEVMQRVVQYLLRVGTDQYDRGYYDQAEKTFLMAQGYEEYLTAAERSEVEMRLKRARAAVLGRARALQDMQTAQGLIAQGGTAEAKAYLEKIKDSEFLTDKERRRVAELLVAPQAVPPRVEVGGRAPSTNGPIDEAPGGLAKVDGGLDALKQRVAELYFESLKAYQAGEFQKAREGFLEVMNSGLIRETMEKSIRGYLARIDSALQAEGPDATRPLAGDEPPKVTSPRVTVSPLIDSRVARAPADTGAGASEAERLRIERLFERSVQLYYDGQLEAARDGFAIVARSGSYRPAPGRRAEDYLVTIDKLLAERSLQPVVQERVEPVVGSVRLPDVPVPVASEGGYIDEINLRRNIIRSHVEALVGEALEEAPKYAGVGEFDKATEIVDRAKFEVQRNQLHLGDALFKQYSSQLQRMEEQISESKDAAAQQASARKRQEAIEAQRQLRVQTEADRLKRIAELMENARAYQKQQRYEAALGQLANLLALDPQNDEALALKSTLEDTVYFRKQLEIEKEASKQRADTLMGADASGIPYADEITYPKDWREIIAKPTRQPDAPIALDPQNIAVYKQLETVVDLSMLTPTMPASDAFEELRRAVQPPLKIVVLWKDLLDNAEIEPTTPIDMDGLAEVQVGTALEKLLEALAGGYAELGYVVEDGVITVATLESLPRQLETRVYDVTDLLGEPANYQGMGMMGMMGMMGGGMMGGMGGYGMGGMGGMGGYG